ncbi:hypothetical protein E2P81_ATG00669 [Venturia nashicola]|nr:hypothetical protein E2P81_ATG00669 [Venturia nashicola]
MADPQPEPDPRYALLESATRNTSKEVAKVISIAKGAIKKAESLQKMCDDFEAKTGQLEEEAQQHAQWKSEYELKITEQKTRLFDVTSTLSQKNLQLKEKDIVIEELRARLAFTEEENESLKETDENLSPKSLIPMTRKPVVVVDLEGVDTDDESDLDNFPFRFDTTNRDSSMILHQYSRTSKELKRQLGTHPDDDEQVSKRPKPSTGLQIRTSINLVATLTQYTIKHVKSRFIEAFIAGSGYKRHRIYPKALVFFELFDVHCNRRLNRVRAIARLHNEKLAQDRLDGVTLTEIQSRKRTPGCMARDIQLQVMYNWYHKMQYKEGSPALRTMAEHFGQGIAVLISRGDFLIKGRTRYRIGELERGLGLLLSMEDFGPYFKHYCELLQRHIWNPIMEGTPIQCDLSVKGRPLMDLLQQHDQKSR